MLFSKKKGLSIDTLIGEGTAIDGDLVFSGGLRLDGKVRGNIRAAGEKPSMLVISEKGMVEGEIAVGHLILNGTVKGRSTRANCSNSSRTRAYWERCATLRSRCTRGRSSKAVWCRWARKRSRRCPIRHPRTMTSRTPMKCRCQATAPGPAKRRKCHAQYLPEALENQGFRHDFPVALRIQAYLNRRTP